jgi:hypothetical protein
MGLIDVIQMGLRGERRVLGVVVSGKESDNWR